MPLGLSYPVHRILRTEVTLPRTWTPEQDSKIISDPAFVFRKTSGCDGKKLGMVYEYQSLSDSVAPDAVADYLRRVKQASQSLGYTLEWR